MKVILKNAQFLLCCSIVLSACDDSSTSVEPAARVLTAAVVPGDTAPHTRLAVTLDKPAPVQVTYWRAQDGRALQIESADTALQHEVFLPRTYASSTYSYQVRALGGQGRLGMVRSGTFSTGDLPAEVASLQFTATGAPADSLVMIEVMVTTSGFGGGLVVLDQDGRVVWYWKGTGGFVMGATRRANGNWAIHDDGYIFEFTPARRLVRQVPRASSATPYGGIHHDLTATMQNTVYFIANETRVFPDSSIVGEAIWEWFPEENRFEKKFSVFDFLSWPADRGPDSDRNNWLHMNSLAVGSRGNVLYSSRATDQVVSIAPDFKSIEWRMGGPNATIPVAGDAHFSGQHNISEVGANRILMWDNGRRRLTGEYSRGLELAVDPVARTATRVAEFRGTPDRLQPIVGGAFRMSNGSTLITYGFNFGENINIYEMTPANITRWHLVAPPAVGRIYKARTLPSIAGEKVVLRPDR